MKRIVSILAVLGVLFSIVSVPVSASGSDPRCGGRYGLEVWENTNKGGRTFTFCSVDGHNLSVSNLSSHSENLIGPVETWNDRISSSETFNANTGTGKASLYVYSDANYGGCVAPHSGNQYWPDYRVFCVNQYGFGIYGDNDHSSSFNGYSQ